MADEAFLRFARQAAAEAVQQLIEKQTQLPPRQVWLNGHAAAAYLDISYFNLQRMSKRGEGPKFALRGSRTRRYHVDDLDTWMRAGGPAR